MAMKWTTQDQWEKISRPLNLNEWEMRDYLSAMISQGDITFDEFLNKTIEYFNRPALENRKQEQVCKMLGETLYTYLTGDIRQIPHLIKMQLFYIEKLETDKLAELSRVADLKITWLKRVEAGGARRYEKFARIEFGNDEGNAFALTHEYSKDAGFLPSENCVLSWIEESVRWDGEFEQFENSRKVTVNNKLLSRTHLGSFGSTREQGNLPRRIPLSLRSDKVWVSLYTRK